jgi:ABC-type sugar transport system substrate-binding protein
MMKRFLIPLLTVAVVGIILIGCVGAPAPKAPTIPAEPAGAWPQPNPYWGLGFKPDGTPYKFAVNASGLAMPYWYAVHMVCLGQLERSGADVTLLNADFSLDKQISNIDDLITKRVDAIAGMSLDSAGIVPAIDRAWEAGIPYFVFTVKAWSDNVVFYSGPDPEQEGGTAGRLMVEIAERTGKQLNVYEIPCPQGMEICQLRKSSFEEAIAGCPLITLMVSTATTESEDKVMNAILDAFPTHPELNALHTSGSNIGAIQALKTLGRWVEIGQPNHVVWVGLDDQPPACEAIRENKLDGCTSNSAWASGDLDAKALLTYVCLGQSVPKEILIPVTPVTLENIDISPYGGPCRWGEMNLIEEDPRLWPILGVEFLGMPTPTYQPH